MDYGKWLALLYLCILSDVIACAIGGYVMLRYRNGFPTVLGLLLSGIFVNGMTQLIAVTIGYESEPKLKLAFVLVFFIGRATQSVFLWTFVLYLLGYRARVRSGDSVIK